jgi:hypothetical protein
VQKGTRNRRVIGGMVLAVLSAAAAVQVAPIVGPALGPGEAGGKAPAIESTDRPDSGTDEYVRNYTQTVSESPTREYVRNYRGAADPRAYERDPSLH